MLPSDATRTITIWPRWQNPISQLIKPMRRVLYFCSWHERSISTALQTGNVLRVPAVIRVFDEASGLVYVPPHIWDDMTENELEGYWTCDISQSAKPLIAPFESEHEFAWGTSAQVTTAENNFRRDKAGATTVTERNDNRAPMGSHIRLGAGA